ncbi:hypothetical protein Q7P37_005244 [Cladosporium fusiforme]
MNHTNILLFLTILSTFVLAAPTPPTLHKRAFPNISGTYSAQQIEQLNAAFDDANQLAQYAVKAPKSVANKVFPKYFSKDDLDTVTNVFKLIAGDLKPKAEKGSPLLSKMTIVDDFLDDLKLMGCSPDTQAEMRDEGTDHPSLIVCPPAFKFGGIAQGFPGVPKVSCGNFDKYVSDKMETLGSILLHEYTHFVQLVSPVLSQGTVDYEYTPEAVQKLDGKQARVNADSYSWYATEVMWSTICKTQYESPP